MLWILFLFIWEKSVWLSATQPVVSLCVYLTSFTALLNNLINLRYMYDLQNRMTKTFRGKKSKDFADKLQLLSQHILNIHDSSCLLFLVSVTNGMDSRNKKQKFCLLEDLPCPFVPNLGTLEYVDSRLWPALLLLGSSWFSVCTAPKHLWFRGVAMHTKNAPSDLLSMIIYWCFELAVSSTMCCTKGFKVLRKCNWNKLLEVALANFLVLT